MCPSMGGSWGLYDKTTRILIFVYPLQAHCTHACKYIELIQMYAILKINLCFLQGYEMGEDFEDLDITLSKGSVTFANYFFQVIPVGI